MSVVSWIFIIHIHIHATVGCCLSVETENKRHFSTQYHVDPSSLLKTFNSIQLQRISSRSNSQRMSALLSNCPEDNISVSAIGHRNFFVHLLCLSPNTRGCKFAVPLHAWYDVGTEASSSSRPIHYILSAMRLAALNVFISGVSPTAIIREAQKPII